MIQQRERGKGWRWANRWVVCAVKKWEVYFQTMKWVKNENYVHSVIKYCASMCVKDISLSHTLSLVISTGNLSRCDVEFRMCTYLSSTSKASESKWKGIEGETVNTIFYWGGAKNSIEWRNGTMNRLLMDLLRVKYRGRYDYEKRSKRPIEK